MIYLRVIVAGKATEGAWLDAGGEDNIFLYLYLYISISTHLDI